MTRHSDVSQNARAEPIHDHRHQTAEVVVSAPARRWHVRARARMASWSAYPRSWALIVLGSRWAKWIEWGSGAVVFIIAATPDFGFTFLRGWGGLATLFLAILASHGLANMVHGTSLAAYHRTLRSLSGVISSIAGSQREDGEPTVWADPNQTIRTLLRRAKEFAETTVKIPVGEEITANLLRPVFEGGKLAGLRATDHDDFYPDRRHDIIPLDAPGAGAAFLTGTPQAIRYTEEEAHPRVRGRKYKSVAAFPVIVGEPANDGLVVAVVSLDSTRAYTFDQKEVEKELYPFVSPVAQLIGLALELREERETENED